MKVGFWEHLKQFIYIHFYRNSHSKRFFKSLYKRMFERHKVNNRNTLFRQNAISVLKAFTDCMDRNDVEYTLAFGSLLGAVREKGFINHDLDIDVAIWYDGREGLIQTYLEKEGFRRIHCFTVDDSLSAREDTFEKDGVTIDIFYLYEAVDRLPYCCDFVKFPDTVDWTMSIYKHGGLLPRRIELPWDKVRVRTPFESLSLFIPRNAHEILRMRYGEDYMIPNPNWVNRLDHPYIVNWDEKIAIYTEELR